MSVIVWECPATQENPCMCDCHTREVDYGGDLGERLSMGCTYCSDGSKLKSRPSPSVKDE